MTNSLSSVAHGFVWPEGLPPCIFCGSDANDTIHVTGGPIGGMDAGLFDSMGMGMGLMAADKTSLRKPRRSHPYMLATPSLTKGITCQACGAGMADGAHAIGMPSGAMAARGQDVRNFAEEGEQQQAKQQTAFVAQIGHRLVLAAPVTTAFTAESLPREVASDWQRASAANPNNIWIAGRYVEADRPNRNAAYWSTEDLELGEPTVSHGPINWLHEEKHIIGAIASSKFVHVERQAADDAGVGNHIVTLGALWPYIWPQEASVIQRASDDGKLWGSMECVSKEVACLTCDKTMSYPEYMRQQARCDHMRDGMPRRFKEPTFGGMGMIVPPVRPGWTNADMKVLMPQAAQLAERQAASFEGLSTSDAELIVAQILAFAGEGGTPEEEPDAVIP